ncbi:MAG: hydrogenase expression/formation protein HypE [Rhodobacteraceae bacterium]|nr:hydrogenase expression/formation protein HypE [Paracoccaceae bacterium]
MALRDTHVIMAHGGGGRAMRDLIEEVFTASFQPPGMEDQARLMDAALQQAGARLAFTTDGFVVAPMEFPGGDIGKLAVCGTINDLVVGGARPLWLSAGFIIEEGTEIALLRRIVASMVQEAAAAGVRIVTGDTKVVERGAADGVFITTSGIGVIPPGLDMGAGRIRAGDAVIVNGPLGDHGAVIMATRGEFALETELQTDCAALGGVMAAALKAAPDLRAARDCTRGGLASALNELAAEAGLGVQLEETLVPLRHEVRGLCEILGLDPLYLANEGRLVLFAPAEQAKAVVAAIEALPEGAGAAIIGHVVDAHPGQVRMQSSFGGSRIVDMLVGDQLPRIC